MTTNQPIRQEVVAFQQLDLCAVLHSIAQYCTVLHRTVQCSTLQYLCSWASPVVRTTYKVSYVEYYVAACSLWVHEILRQDPFPPVRTV